MTVTTENAPLETLTFSLTHEDAIAAVNRPQPWSARARAAWLIGITTTAFVLGIAWDWVNPFFAWAHPLEGLTVALFVFAAWALPTFAISLTAARSRIRAVRAPTAPTALKLYADRIEIAGQGAKPAYRLIDLAKPELTNERLVIDASTGDTLIIPLAAFANKDAYLAFANLLDTLINTAKAET